MFCNFIKLANESAKQISLMKFLSRIAMDLGVADDVYVVGGAVRNWLLKKPIKDVDVVVDSIALGNGRSADWFATEVSKRIPVKTTVVSNQYGVSILHVHDEWNLDGFDMKGEIIEIANARKESYGAGGKGYKPTNVESATIKDDVKRRDFSVNSLLWRMSDLEDGPENAEVIDIMGKGTDHVKEMVLETTVDPDVTFKDDPTRMLRAMKFMIKYGFNPSSEIIEAINRNAFRLKQMPAESVKKIFVDDILKAPNPVKSLAIMKQFGLMDVLVEIANNTKSFIQALNNELLKIKNIDLWFEMIDLGFDVDIPLFNKLSDSQLKKLRMVIESMSDDQKTKFMEVVNSPPLLNQKTLFSKYDVPYKSRKMLVEHARDLLLDDPGLMDDVERLNQLVEEMIDSNFNKI